ncbi:MAG: glycosyltransferase [Clostridia bacterium]|nr:glycosyltransferase [Clostridia bacterium]
MIQEKKPLVSVIVPVYQVEAYLEKCVLSVLRQDMRDFELILVNDGSPDGCGAICERFARQDQRIRYIRKENGGLSDARNAGIGAAAGEYLSFIDADDFVEPTYLSYLLSLTREAPGCKVSQANHFVERNGKSKPSAPIEGTAVFSPRDAFEAVLYHDRVDVSGWGKLYHRSVFETLRFPKGRLYEDTWLFGDVLNATPVYVYGGQPQYHYVQRGSSIVNQAFSEKNLQYLEAVERLTDIAMKTEPSLEAACQRRRTHAWLSVLRYMEDCPPEYAALRDELRQKALASAPQVCADRRTPKRDKLALRLLKAGYFPFYKVWRLYSRVR